MSNILVVDDEQDITNLIKRVLEKDGHNVDTKNKASDVDVNSLGIYSLILLDVMMPEVDGFTFCKKIRSFVSCPIIFLTAKTSENDMINGLMIGADDYIKKPFSISELRARVTAHIRRENRTYKTGVLINNIRFDFDQMQVYFEENKINFTKSEYLICEFLAKNRGQVFSLEQILENSLGYESESDTSAIREHVKNIRAKLSKYDVKPIETVWGIGYKWN